MIKGEGNREISSEVASPDKSDEFLPWQGDKSYSGDGSPVSSQYSSCGESEFDRYCSATSVMGTPSLCSSVGTFQECVDAELGSLKNFRLENDGGSENFTLGERFNRHSEYKKVLGFSQRIECCDGKSDAELKNKVESGQRVVEMKNGLNSYDNVENSSSHEFDSHSTDNGNLMPSKAETLSDLNIELDEELFGEDDFGSVVPWRDGKELGSARSSQNDHYGDDASAEAIEGIMLNLGPADSFHSSAIAKESSQSYVGIEQVDSCIEGSKMQSDLGSYRNEAGRGSDEGESSSRYEHSDDEDSMFGTDDEKKIDLYYGKNITRHQESNRKNENLLLMTSSIAFGSDDWDDFMQETEENAMASMVPEGHKGQKPHSAAIELDNMNPTTTDTVEFSSIALPEQQAGMREISVAQVQGNDNIVEFGDVEQGEVAKDELVESNLLGVTKSADYLETSSVSVNTLEKEHDLLTEAPLKKELNIRDGGLKSDHQYTSTEDVTGMDDGHVSESIELEKIKLQLDPLSDVTFYQHCSASQVDAEDRRGESFGENKSSSTPPLIENSEKIVMEDSHVSPKLSEDHLTSVKTENLESNEFFNDFVHEMEEILLDSGNTPWARFTRGSRTYPPLMTRPLRDGGSTASTSAMDDTHLVIHHPVRIDGVEVVGARQKRGDVSLSERLVGVKEYTVYRIRVWSGENHWEVERRYRDFCTLYRCLNKLFVDQGCTLPSPWSFVERESRKIFGNASPDVIAERSVLIQECLGSILHSKFSSSLPNALIWFLSPPKEVPSSPTSDTHMPQSPYSTRSTDTEDVSTLGKTISLVIQTRPYKSTKQMLDAQHYTCAGCHKHFDDAKSLMREVVWTLGWGKPRLCEYSGQLFCPSCHSNETAVLPARVLHYWDFTQYPVSQLAKSYLDSIHDQPMLCVSAVNPFLFSRVPALQQVMNLRKQIGAMLAYARCPFRRSIYKGLGSRRYLLKSNDFFALRDLVDLSKGMFAALPQMMENVSRKILEHITEQCLICCDLGIPCNARQECEDLTSLIFPFQVRICLCCALLNLYFAHVGMHHKHFITFHYILYEQILVTVLLQSE
ncbi:unnamed protein product [Ilex paraguariensis]|uniref:PX domain-containing protein n=1 Tax=Ilex paraguariensis TaxID=185542 RepID=A0ABC8R3K6_9AQUA